MLRINLFSIVQEEMNEFNNTIVKKYTAYCDIRIIQKQDLFQKLHII